MKKSTMILIAVVLTAITSIVLFEPNHFTAKKIALNNNYANDTFSPTMADDPVAHIFQKIYATSDKVGDQQIQNSSIIPLQFFPKFFYLDLNKISNGVPSSQIDSIKKIFREVCEVAKIPTNYNSVLYFKMRERSLKRPLNGRVIIENIENECWVELSRLSKIETLLKNLDRRVLQLRAEFKDSLFEDILKSGFEQPEWFKSKKK